MRFFLIQAYRMVRGGGGGSGKLDRRLTLGGVSVQVRIISSLPLETVLTLSLI